MKIQTNNLTLRSFSLNDAYGYYNMVYNDHIIAQFVPYAYVSSLKAATASVQAYHAGDCVNDFYLVIEQEGVIVGCIIAVRSMGKVLDTSVLVGEKYRGNGIMKEALTAFIDWLRCNTSYKYLSLVIKYNNLTSQRLAESCGAKFMKSTLEGNIYKINI